MKNNMRKLCGLPLILAAVFPASAEVITIGKGSGIVWEGLPFNKRLTGALDSPVLFLRYGLLSVSNSSAVCTGPTSLKQIAGYWALPLGDSGAGLIPRATGTATYYRYEGSYETLTGTVGLPQTKGNTSAGATTMPHTGYEWCLPPSMSENQRFYSTYGNRTASLVGTWVIVADGNQKNAEVRVPTMYFGSFSAVGSGDRSTQILPNDITLRISSLECTVNTPTAIDFKNVTRITEAGAQLALLSYPLITTCGQPDNKISANINLQFRAITGLDSGNAARLALRQGGGWITGEISNGATGSGACTSTSGIPFDNKPVKLGAITNSETSKSLNHQVTWRLCSAGSSLPEGAVDAAAEMLVTFN
ncbi:hypothetical protein [Enterobacter dykesii]|uniref:hypothetical protein n=1 Tax=Enterobacter dykesii TaxID=2797506 RepID=UPI0032B5478B